MTKQESTKPARRPLLVRGSRNTDSTSIDTVRVVKPGDPDYERAYAEAVRMHGFGYEMDYADDKPATKE